MRLKRVLAVITLAAGLAFAVALFINEGIGATVIFLVLASLFLLRGLTLRNSSYSRGAISNTAANARSRGTRSRTSRVEAVRPMPTQATRPGRIHALGREAEPRSSACASTRSPR